MPNVMPRSSSFAEVLGELEEVKQALELEEKQHKIRQQQTPAAPQPLPATRKAAPPAVAAPSHRSLFDVALLGVALAVGAALVGGWTRESAVALPACLMALALALLGVGQVAHVVAQWRAAPRAAAGASWLRVPLTDSALSIEVCNKFANSCQVREKGLKIVQYVLRLCAYSAVLSPGISAHLKLLSKTTSIARRFFKFCRWVKHLDDLKAAQTEKNGRMRGLLVLRGLANICADWSEDVCSLERIGLLPPGTLSIEFALGAEYCQLALALVEVTIASVLVDKQRQLLSLVTDSANDPKGVSRAERQLTMLRLELVKFVSDIGKAVYDSELPFAHEGVFLCCALFSALLSTHKNMVKVLSK